MRGQGAELPCGVWGNAPTLSRATAPKEVANQGAGSEASLPVTLRSRRSAPKPLFPTCAVSRQMGATELLVLPTIAALFRTQGVRLCGGEEGALRSPPPPLRSAPPCYLIFLVAGISCPCCLTFSLQAHPLLLGHPNPPARHFFGKPIFPRPRFWGVPFPHLPCKEVIA